MIARLDATYYNDPTRLYNAQTTSIRLTSGGVQANYDFGYFDVDAAFGDSGMFG
ncbi:MAG: hypothetical protein WKF77_26620 [Planctomycetaceae bacterium]